MVVAFRIVISLERGGSIKHNTKAVVVRTAKKLKTVRFFNNTKWSSATTH